MQLLKLLFAGLAAASAVTELDKDTFDKYIEEQSVALIEFYAPWCGHCKALAPEYEKAAAELKDYDVGLAKVDCTTNEELCKRYEVFGFPTMKVFRNTGEEPAGYEGTREASGIVSYMIRRKLPPVSEIKASTEINDILKQNEVAFVAYVANKADNETYYNIARAKSDYVVFAATSDESVFPADVEKGQSKLLVYKRGDMDPFAHTGDFSQEVVNAFVTQEMFPTFGAIHSANYRAYADSGVPLMFLFVESDEDKLHLRVVLSPHREKLRGKVNMVFLNAKDYGSHADNLGIRPEFPAIVIHDLLTEKRYAHPQIEDISLESVTVFIDGYLAGLLEPVVKSEEIPETQDEAAFKLVGRAYDDIVLDDKKDVLVEYYAPWCGHCKTLAPIYEQLAELYSNDDTVVIAKMDHTLNEVPDVIKGYPTIKFYPAGGKKEPLVFSGKRTLEELSEFVRINAKAGGPGPKEIEHDDDEEEDDKEEL